MHALEYCEHLYSAQTPKKSDLQHHGIKGMHWDERRFQNLDGSLTPEGRIRYGVGMSREEMAEARAAEEARQRDIDYNRSKSIREMDDYELQNAVNRSRMEQQFEANMIMRSNNFLQSKVTEERLNQEYDDLMYQKSRQKAERFMERTERLGRFIGNLAGSYGKIVDVKGKIEDVRAKKALADKNEWQSEQEHAKADKERWNFDKSKSEYERSLAERLASAKKDLSEAKADLDAGKSKKELKAEAKAAKKAGKMSNSDYDKTVEFWEKEAESARKSGDKVKEYNAKAMAADAKARKADSGDHEYIRKEGDTYIYDDKTKAGWESTKEKSKGLIGRALEKRREAKREKLKDEAMRGITEDRRIARDNALNKNSSQPSYWEQYNRREENLGYLKRPASSSTNSESSTESTPSRQASLNKIKGLTSKGKEWKEKLKSNKDSGANAITTNRNWDSYLYSKEVRKAVADERKKNGDTWIDENGGIMNKTRYKRKHHIKHSEEE